jgi:tryptophan synthase alpha chain
MTQAPSQSRLQNVFAQARARGDVAIIPYLTVGFPQRESTVALATAVVQGGAAAIELGIPFSDPLADGVTIQRASQVALANGVTVRFCLETAAQLRQNGVDVPLIFMGYYNPLLQYGLEQFIAACVEVGVDGLIVPDLPPQESDELLALCQEAGRDLIQMVAPTSTDQLIAEAAARARGFIYCVSVTGVTGARTQLPEDLPAFIARVRRVTTLPLVLGFGIARPEHVHAAAALVDGVVVGSALLDRIASAPPSAQAEVARAFLEELRS